MSDSHRERLAERFGADIVPLDLGIMPRRTPGAALEADSPRREFVQSMNMLIDWYLEHPDWPLPDYITTGAPVNHQQLFELCTEHNIKAYPAASPSQANVNLGDRGRSICLIISVRQDRPL